ncbi:MAG: glycoside hydrolase family 3 N-terminal domain-containing protein [Oliverpabstia sp.]
MEKGVKLLVQKKIVARSKGVIEVDGLKFKDLDGTGELKPYEDWRLTPEERAKDLVSRMNNEEKAGLMVIHDLPMGISTPEGKPTSHNGVLNEQFEEVMRRGMKVMQYPTTLQLASRHIRHIIVRENAKPSEFVAWVNAMQEVCEGTRWGIPCIVASNSKNESSDIRYDASQEANKFTTFPGTLGLAASRNMDTIEKFAKIVHDEFYVSNIRKGYMYMADCATDPRWFRTYGTFGEHPDLICDIMPRVIKGIQGETLDENSVAVTTKHFPGGGARENGFDPHYAEGKYNCYNTPGSMDTYHLPAFKASIAAGTSSIMPYYAIPSNKKSGFPQNGVDKFDEEIAFAYNDQFINGFLRNDLGFDGIVNSDTGVMGNCAWGAEMYNQAGRAARILHAGTDMVSGENDPAPFLEAVTKGYIDQETFDQAAARLLTELFRLGLFENPYADENAADAVVNTEETKAIAYKAHQESIVVLKNQNAVLPLTLEKLEGKKVYVEMLMRTDYSEKELQAMALSGSAANPKETVAAFPKKIKEDNPQITFVDDYKEADVAVLFLKPASGSYFEATDGYLELNIQKSTGVDVDHIREIREAVGQVVMHINLNLPYLLTNVEPLADAVTVGFDSFSRAAFDVIKGDAAPVGKLPITLPGSDAAIAVDENGICASPNDVPGYDKAKYMKDGLTYAYKDAAGNEYIYGFGLTY